MDDDAPETDETGVKEDSSVRPAGRFEVSYFDQTETDAVGVGFTYGLEIDENGREGSYDYGVNDEQPIVIRRHVDIRFTRSNGKRYMRLTEAQSGGGTMTTRFEYKMSRGTLRLRQTYTSNWISLVPTVTQPDLALLDAVKVYYSEHGNDVDQDHQFGGRLPCSRRTRRGR